MFPSYLLYFHTLAHSFALNKKSTLLFSSNSELFCKNTRGGGEGAISVSRSIRGCLPSSVHSSKFRMSQLLCLPLLRKHRGSPPSSQRSLSSRRSSALGRLDVRTFGPSDVPLSRITEHVSGILPILELATHHSPLATASFYFTPPTAAPGTRIASFMSVLAFLQDSRSP